MIEAILKISSENYYSCELTRSIPVRVSLVTINGPEGFGIIESLDGTEKSLQKYVKFMKNSSSISEFEVTHKSDQQYWTRAVHTITGESIHDAVLENGCMTRLPIIITKGSQFHTIYAPSQKAFSQMLSNLKERFTSVKIERVRRFPSGMTSPLLTRKQSEAIALAFSHGYYEIPRETEIEPIAKYLGIKRVAMQERLRRAERAIIKEYVHMNNL
ncbi:MAG: helix-turn-helix domain-containing protein [Candidatus Thorarchaeota archaeon]